MFYGTEYVVFNGFDMLLHRLPGKFRVVSLDGDEDLAVGCQRFVGATPGLQGFLPYRLQDIHDRRHEPLESRVVDGLADGEMKCRIAIHRGGAARDLLFLCLQDLLQP